ncbi:transposase [Methylomicrobium sp. RS1]|nr:transposase [Methylomicrobium sp. RS1]
MARPTTTACSSMQFWILRAGAPWRDLPPDYGDWKNTHRRFCRWRDCGVFGKRFWNN